MVSLLTRLLGHWEGKEGGRENNSKITAKELNRKLFLVVSVNKIHLSWVNEASRKTHHCERDHRDIVPNRHQSK